MTPLAKDSHNGVTELNYGLSVGLDVPYEVARALVIDALRDEGFGVLTEIDVRRTLKEKIGADFQPYAILGACNPTLAHAALTRDVDAGLLLPCNVVVRQYGDGAVVSLLDPLLISRLSPVEGLQEIAASARKKIERVATRLAESNRAGAA